MQKNRENPPRRLDLTVPSHGSDECDDRKQLAAKEKPMSTIDSENTSKPAPERRSQGRL